MDDVHAVGDLERAAAAWEYNNRHEDWLLTGARLDQAEALLGRDEFRARLVTAAELVRVSAEVRESVERERLWEATGRRLVGQAREMLEGISAAVIRKHSN